MIEIIHIISNFVLAILIVVLIVTEKNSADMLHGMKDLLYTIFQQLNHLQMDQTQLAADLAALTEKQAKANAEIVSKIGDLENALANGGPVTTEVQAALDALKATVQASDDIVQDPPVGGGEEEEQS